MASADGEDHKQVVRTELLNALCRGPDPTFSLCSHELIIRLIISGVRTDHQVDLEYLTAGRVRRLRWQQRSGHEWARTVTIIGHEWARAKRWMQDVAREISVPGLRPAERAAVATHLVTANKPSSEQTKPSFCFKPGRKPRLT